MRHARAWGVMVVVLAGVLPAAAQTAEQNQRIASGETVTWVEGAAALKTCVAIGLIDCPPEKVYRAMTDYAHYPQVFHLLSTAQILHRSGNTITVHYTMSPPWPLTQRVVTTLTTLDEAHHAIHFRQIDGNVKTYEGDMIAAPWGNHKTRFTYRTRVDPGIAFLPNWAITWGTRVSLPGVVRDLGNYARHLP